MWIENLNLWVIHVYFCLSSEMKHIYGPWKEVKLHSWLSETTNRKESSLSYPRSVLGSLFKCIQSPQHAVMPGQGVRRERGNKRCVISVPKLNSGKWCSNNSNNISIVKKDLGKPLVEVSIVDYSYTYVFWVSLNKS